LRWVSLNEGRLTLNPEPVAGRDETDGVVRIEAVAAAVPAPTVAKPGMLSALAQALRSRLAGGATAGLNAVQLRLTWEGSVLELLEVDRGSATGDFQWYIERNTGGELYVDMSRLEALGAGSGSVLELKFRANASAQAGVVDLDLRWVSLNEGRLTLNPQPQAGRDETDGQVRIEAVPAPAPTVVKPGLLSALAQALRSRWLGAGSTGAGLDGQVSPLVAAAAIPAPSITSEGVRTLPRVEMGSTGTTSPALTAALGQRGWLRGFVAQTPAPANTNANLKVVLPSTAQVSNAVTTRV